MELHSQQDRRVQKTKKLLWEALVKLILKKGYEAVTIQDIIDEANVGRSTFYSHYESKEHLLLGAQAHLTDMLAMESDQAKIDFRLMYQHAKRNRKIARAILGKKGGNVLVNHIKQMISFKLKQQFTEELENTKGKDKEYFQLKLTAIAAALHSLLSNWIEQNMQISIDKMVTLSEELVNVNLP